MAHVRRMLEAKFQQEVVQAKRRQEFDKLDTARKDQLIAEHREHQKMLRLVG